MNRIVEKASSVRSVLRKLGQDALETAAGYTRKGGFPTDFEAAEIEDYQRVAPYTLAGPERTVTLMRAIHYLTENQVPGDIVECGVWKGGSMMAACLTLNRLEQSDRRLWLYDTFSGMSEPTPEDVSTRGFSAWGDYEAEYLSVGLENVRKAVLSTGYEEAKISFVKGKVEDSIPDNAPEQIALLRLDTDWYESTRHELVHLFPRLAKGGILIVDDYGHWKGARKATDEYFRENGIPFFLNRIDFSCRMGVKL